MAVSSQTGWNDFAGETSMHGIRLANNQSKNAFRKQKSTAF